MSVPHGPLARPPRAFISYARADGEAFASSLRQRLQTEHPDFTLWQDRAELEGGVGWWKQITDALDEVELLIMVLTPAAIVSAVALKEWRYARQQGVRVCPVLGSDPREFDFNRLPSWMRKVTVMTWPSTVEDFDAVELAVDSDARLAVVGSLLGTLCVIDLERGRSCRPSMPGGATPA